MKLARALVREGKDADSSYREAIDRLGRTQLHTELGRAHLLYGEWLRRAHKMFTGFGMEAFAERAGIELRAPGAQTLKRTAGTPDVLTAQEALRAIEVRQVCDRQHAALRNASRAGAAERS